MIIDRPVLPVRVDLLTGTHRVDQFECYFMLDLGSSADKAGENSLTRENVSNGSKVTVRRGCRPLPESEVTRTFLTGCPKLKAKQTCPDMAVTASYSHKAIFEHPTLSFPR